MITGTYNLTVNPQWINVQQQEVFLECDTTLAPVTINLFEIVELNRFWGVKIIISDANNNAGTNNITVNSSGSDTVDDDTTNQIVINTNGSSVSFQVASETQWLAIESVVAGLTPTAPYKVFTALLTQNGGDNPQFASSVTGTLIIGVTYLINDNLGGDFTNVGAPNNNNGTYFVATGTTPNAWGGGGSTLIFNTGAPVATVLENTIGNIWFTYVNAGFYEIKSDGLFIIDKTWGIGDFVYDSPNGIYQPVFVNVSNAQGAELPNTILVRTVGGDFNGDSLLNNTPIEIRVYN